MKFLIVGAGMIGQTHARALKKLNLTFALCDNTPENVNAVADEFGIEERYSDYVEALQVSHADAVIVCTPNHLHAPVAIEAMKYGVDVLCEKPMASTSRDAGRMLECARSTGRKMMVGYILRSGDAIYRTKEYLMNESLGRVLSMRCILAAPETLEVAKTPYRKSYETGGGIIYDYTHEIDYVRYLLGDPSEGFCFCDGILKTDQSVDDTADILLHYSSGTAVHLHLDYLQERGRGRGRCFEIVTEKGFLSCDFKKLHVYYNDGRDIEETFATNWDLPFERQIQRFMEMRDGKTVSCATAEDGFRVMEIADALYMSARQGKLVTL